MRQKFRGCSPSSQTLSGHRSTHWRSIFSPAWYWPLSAERMSMGLAGDYRLQVANLAPRRLSSRTHRRAASSAPIAEGQDGTVDAEPWVYGGWIAGASLTGDAEAI